MHKKLFYIPILVISFQIVSAQVPNSQTNTSDKPNQAETRRKFREQAYVKLLEGQRIMLNLSRPRSEAEYLKAARLAKDSLQKAVEFDPTLAEGYTALAELTLSMPPNDLEQSVLLANIAVKLNPNNYGGHRILARLYTIKSRLNRGESDAVFSAKAITEWNEIVRLDSRNAEAFAFLSEFYGKTNKPAERIKALRQWLAAGESLEPGFYQTFTGGSANLSQESAAVKLGEALLDDGQTRESIEILSRTVAENPENTRAVELLREAVEISADGKSGAAAVAVQSLTRAVYANPENTSLITLLAQTLASSGKVDEAAKVLRENSLNFAEKNAASASELQIVLADIYANAEMFDDSIKSFDAALNIRGIDKTETTSDADRDFAIRVFEKMIQTYKKANRTNDAKILIERARTVLGKEDSFPDRQLIVFYRETGKMSEALQTIRAVRTGKSEDYGLLRLEASILTDIGKVDEAVALIKPLINKKSAPANSNNGAAASEIKNLGNNPLYLPMYDDFTNYIFISNLYAQAKRGREAVEAANQAAISAQDSERKQIAKLTLATAQQSAGNFQEAETTLRELLKQTPGNPIALNNLGYFLVERDMKLTEALDLIRQAVKIDSTNPSFLDSLGWAYFKLGNLAEAEQSLKDALRFNAASPTIHEHLGDVHQKQGKFDLAKSSWQKSLNLTSEAQQVIRLKSKLKTQK